MDADLFDIDEVFKASDLRHRRLCLAQGPQAAPRPLAQGRLEAASEEPPFSRRMALSRRAVREEELEALETVIEGPPPWFIGFSKQFKKDTDSLDRKLLGRVLEALEEISGYSVPLHTVGDTFKPLSGELEGCWRYRIGDHRLVVKPVTDLAQINALTLGARGSVYD